MTGEQQMRLGGWALLINALIGAVFALLLLFDVSYPRGVTLVQLVGVLLFLVGLQTIALLQPRGGQVQWIGLSVMALAAMIAGVGLILFLLDRELPDPLPFTSALCGMLGDLLVAAITLRQHAVPRWAAWLLAVSGVVNLVTGQLDGGDWLRIVAAGGAVLGAAAIAGYGSTAVARTASEQPALLAA
jgi:hypothetical protein